MYDTLENTYCVNKTSDQFLNELSEFVLTENSFQFNGNDHLLVVAQPWALELLQTMQISLWKTSNRDSSKAKTHPWAFITVILMIVFWDKAMATPN